LDVRRALIWLEKTSRIPTSIQVIDGRIRPGTA
jgi:hypothetical protein